MQILLTPSDISTLWHMCEQVMLPSGEKYYYFPYLLKDLGDGNFDRIHEQKLPDTVKEAIRKNKGEYV